MRRDRRVLPPTTTGGRVRFRPAEEKGWVMTKNREKKMMAQSRRGRIRTKRAGPPPPQGGPRAMRGDRKNRRSPLRKGSRVHCQRRNLETSECLSTDAEQAAELRYYLINLNNRLRISVVVDS